MLWGLTIPALGIERPDKITQQSQPKARHNNSCNGGRHGGDNEEGKHNSEQTEQGAVLIEETVKMDSAERMGLA